MSVLDHLAQAAAVILLVELMVILIVFLAISGGLAFGLHWGRGKLGPLLEKGNTYVQQVPRYTEIATDYAARPVITAAGLSETVRATLEAIERRVREIRPAASRQAPPPQPSSPADEKTESIEPLTTT
jgi:hypothetical protein